MNNIFKKIPLVNKNFIQKIFGQEPKENAFIELNNLFAIRKINEITVTNILDIENKYKLKIFDEFSLEIENLFEKYLIKCLYFDKIDIDEKDNLNYLKLILKISDNKIESIYQKLGIKIYEKAYDKYIKENNSPDTNTKILEEIATEFKLTNEIIDNITSKSRADYIDKLFKKVTADEILSPEKWDEFTKLAKKFKVNLIMDEKTKLQIEKRKNKWQIQNEDLKTINVNINLQKDEICFYQKNNIDRLEHRTVTRRINYSGPVARIRIMKGIYYRAGSVAVERVTSDLIQKIDYGNIFLTNKRIIFMGSKKNFNIRLDKILSFIPYSDGVEIEKDSGKNPIFGITTNPDIFAMILSKLINENSQRD